MYAPTEIVVSGQNFGAAGMAAIEVRKVGEPALLPVAPGACGALLLDVRAPGR